MSIFNYKQRNNIVLVSIVVLGVFLLYALSGLFSAILGAIVLYTIFRPFYLYLVAKKGWNKSLVALIIIFGSLVIIVIPFITLSFMIIGKITELSHTAFHFQVWEARIDEFALTNLKQAHFAETTMQKFSAYGADLFGSILTSVVGVILTLLALYFILYFMLVQMDQFEAGLLKYAPFREQHALKFAVALKNSTYSNVLGQGIIALTQGTLLAMGFYAVEIPDGIFWGVIGAFISFLPVVGAPTLSIPAAIYLFATGHSLKAIFILVYGLIIIGNIDNVLRMMINKRIGNTHPIITVVGVFIGIPLFGILGLVFGPVLLSYFLLLLEIYETNRMAADRLERMRIGQE